MIQLLFRCVRLRLFPRTVCFVRKLVSNMPSMARERALQTQPALPELGKRLGQFVWDQLKRQEGDWIGSVRGAVLFLDEGTLLVRWEGNEPVIERCDGVERPSFSTLAMLSQAHPPMLDLSQAGSYPFRVPYSCSAGAMASRTGVLVVQSGTEIDDEVGIMS